MVQTPPAVQTPPEAPTSLDTLAAQINSAHVQFQEKYKTSLVLAYQIGGLLVQAKAQVAHGGWLSWIEENCAFGERTAQTYMKVFRQWDTVSKSAETADLTIDGALQLLSEKNDVLEAEFVEEEDTARPTTINRSRRLRLKGGRSRAKRQTTQSTTQAASTANKFPPGVICQVIDPRAEEIYGEQVGERVQIVKIENGIAVFIKTDGKRSCLPENWLEVVSFDSEDTVFQCLTAEDLLRLFDQLPQCEQIHAAKMIAERIAAAELRSKRLAPQGKSPALVGQTL